MGWSFEDMSGACLDMERGVLCLTSAQTTANSYLIIKGGHAVLVDAADSEEVISFLDGQKCKLDKILLTHEHVDHIFGLNQIRDRYGAPVLAAAACSQRIQDKRENLSVIYDMLVYSYTGAVSKDRHRPFACQPCEETFDLDCSFSWQGHEFALQSMPGHSPGSCVVEMDEEVLFTGDYLLAGTPVNLDLLGGSREDYQEKTRPWLSHYLTQKRMEGRLVWICPGHGAPYVSDAIEWNLSDL